MLCRGREERPPVLHALHDGFVAMSLCAAKYAGGSAKLYGTLAAMPDPQYIVESAATFLDSLFVTVGRGAAPSKYAGKWHK